MFIPNSTWQKKKIFLFTMPVGSSSNASN